MKKLEIKIRTYPLFAVFIVIFCISLLSSKLLLLNNNRNKTSEVLLDLSGEVYRLSWNGETDFIFVCHDTNGNKYRILIKGTYLEENERESILKNGYVTSSKLKVIKPEISSNRGEFDYASYLKAKKTDYYSYAPSGSFELCEKEKFHSIGFYSSKIRSCFSESLYRYFDEDFASIIMAIMTGDTGLMDIKEKTAINLSGFSHLVAVSGAHIAFFTKPFAILLKRTTFSAGKRKVILLVPVFFIWFMAGGSPSVTRAMLMTVLGSIATLLKKPSSMVNSVGFAGVIQLAVNPYACLDTGFLLSYGASISLGIIMPWLLKKIKTKNYFVNLFVPGIAVNLGILPISLSLFGSFSICGLILNVLAGEIAGLLCVGGYLIVLFDRLMSFLPVKQGAAILTSLAYAFEKISAFISNQNSWFFKIEVKIIPIVLIVIYYLVLFFLISKRKPKVIVVAALLLASVFVYNEATTKITVCCLDVGQGSCQLVRTCDGITGLVDTGNGDKDIAELLKREGVSKLNFIILTHGHDDHYGGLSDVLENIEVNEIFIPSNSYDDYCNKLFSDAENIKITKVYGESAYSLGKYSVLHMYESNFDTDNLNNGSIVSIISGNWGNVLLPGDSETEFMDELLSRNVEISSEIYFAAHHGSKTSVNEKFLCDVSPKYAIISVGYNNSYGHPSDSFLSQLQTLGVDENNIFRTDVSGEIILKCGNNIFGRNFVRIWQKKPKPA